MVRLFEQEMQGAIRQSSKGNQLKWLKEEVWDNAAPEQRGVRKRSGETMLKTWYKADYTGYEGLAEYMVSRLLGYSNMSAEEYVVYDTEKIQYSSQIYLGCKSINFLPKGWQMITLERLFKNNFGQSLYKSLYTIENHEYRLKFLVDQVQRITGIDKFGSYMCKLLTLDAFFLNEDRHTHNIAVLLDPEGTFHCCPFFDHGAALLADTKMDYPMGEDVIMLMEKVRAKTFCRNFDEQLEIAERLYGQRFRFFFGEKEIQGLLEEEKYYPPDEKARVREVLLSQRRKYAYLFEN